MKKLLIALVAFVFLVSADTTQQPEFDVHEWGCFMFYQGIGVDFLSRAEVDLPDFVVRKEPEKIHDDKCDCDNCQKAKCTVCGRKGCNPENHVMKDLKPVINFYSKETIKINLTVESTDGYHTVWYPKHSSINKNFTKLSWENFTITPKHDKDVKNAKGCTWWDMARDTESSYVITKDGTVEKFLFYEGESKTLQAAIEIKKEKDKITLINKTSHKYASVLVVNDKKIIHIEELGKSTDIILGKGEIDQKTAREKLEKMLLNDGLNEKEAKGVAKIWEKEFFATDGLRVIYMMAREDVDKSLPITITPKPKKFNRAMIGCVNDTDSIVEGLIKKLGHEDPQVRDSATQTLIKLGKSIIKQLEKAKNETKDPEVKSRLENILAEIDKRKSELNNKKWMKDGKCVSNCDKKLWCVPGSTTCPKCETRTRYDGCNLCLQCAEELGICAICQKKKEN